MKNTWLHVHECALLGLPAAVRGDQCLHLGAHFEAEDQVIGRHVQTLADQTKLTDVGQRIAAFPARYSGLVHVGAIASHSYGKFRLREPSDTACGPKANMEAVTCEFGPRVELRSFVGRPLADGWVIEASKPFTLELLRAGVSAAANQCRFALNVAGGARESAVFDKLDAGAGDTIRMGCDAGLWVDAPTRLDVPVAEQADVEEFHLGPLRLWDFGGAIDADQLRPVKVPVVRPQIPAPKLVLKCSLNADALGRLEAAAPSEGLIKGLLIDASFLSQAAPVFGCNLLLHVAMIAIR